MAVRVRLMKRKKEKKKNVQKNKNQKKRLAMQVREVEILNVHFNKVKCRRRGEKHRQIHNIQKQNNTEWTETQYKKNSSWTGNKSIPKSSSYIKNSIKRKLKNYMLISVM